MSLRRRDKSISFNQEEDQRQPGCVLHFTNVGEGTSREDLKVISLEAFSFILMNDGKNCNFMTGLILH